MHNLLVTTFLFFLPAFIANGSPVVGKVIPGIRPLFKKSIEDSFGYKSKNLFGKHKTWIGLFLGFIGGIIGGVLVYLLNIYLFEAEFFINNLWLSMCFGLVLGVGTMLGDLLKSYFKRKFKIASGKVWFPFDQIDFIIGAWIASTVVVPLAYSWPCFVLALVITPPLHFFTNWLAFKMMLKEVWW